MLSPLHAGHKQQGQEGTRGTSSLQCIVPSTTLSTPQHPCSSAGLSQGNEPCSREAGFNLWERHLAAAWKHLTVV